VILTTICEAPAGGPAPDQRQKKTGDSGKVNGHVELGSIAKVCPFLPCPFTLSPEASIFPAMLPRLGWNRSLL
jgi:hypothetical protein